MSQNLDLSDIVRQGCTSLAKRAAESLERFKACLASVSCSESETIGSCKALLEKTIESGTIILDDAQYKHFANLRKLCEKSIPTKYKPHNHASLYEITIEAFLAYRTDMRDKTLLMSQLSSKGLNVILADSFTGCITQANASGQHINILHYSFIPEAPALATLFLVNEIYKSLLPETQNYRKLLQELYAIDGVNDLIGFLQEHEEYKTDFLKTLVKSNIFHYLSRLEILNLAEERDVDTEKLAEFLRENTATFDFQDMYSIGSGYIYADEVIGAHPQISNHQLAHHAFRLMALGYALTKSFETVEHIPKLLIAPSICEYLKSNPELDLRFSSEFHQSVSQFLADINSCPTSEKLI